ncbi:HASPIN protein kinase [Emergomyces africanus]|uniref:non-specific serine/threonine protein kinase n=1 Tax=Emergomyces africanus TaxID=1955775 RepID=A0A1B7NSJ7_9EURO|nr:HASPIN protein kinase [Emergomyces africanus]
MSLPSPANINHLLPSTKKPSRNTYTYTKRTTISTTSVTSSTAGGTVRVYGKRKENAPRAVLEQENNSSTSNGQKERGAGAEIDNMITVVEGSLSALQLDVNLESKDDGDDGNNQAEQQQDVLRERVAQQGDQAMVGVCIRPYNKEVQRHAAAPREDESTISRFPETTAKPKRKPPRRSSGWIEDLKLNNYVRPILKEATSPISSRGIQRFASWARRAGDMFTVEKIAEGSYGEVYQLRLSRDISKCNLSKSRLARLKAYKDGVFKIIPLRAQRGVGSKKFTTVREIVSEVQMLKLLDPIPGFARFREVHVVQGRFPDAYQQAWTRYSQTNESDCLNPDPGKAKSYPDTQLWAILEMDNAGCELEKFPWSSTFQVYDIFWGVALALARAEQFAAFEHRDLHLGNICIKPTKNGGNIMADLSRAGSGAFEGGHTGFGLSGLETTIIDYSLSRAELQPVDSLDEDGVPEAERRDSAVTDIAWSDLDKRQIFGAIGRDEDEKLLRDTYRYMRSEVYHQDNLLSPIQPPTKPRQWKGYNPRTNLIWLSFLLQMLLKQQKPSGAYQPGNQQQQQQQLQEEEEEEQRQRQQRQRQPLTPRPTNHNLHRNSIHNHHHNANGNSVFDDGGDSPRKPPASKNYLKLQVPSSRDAGNDVGKKNVEIALQEELALRLRTTADMLSVENGFEDLYCAGDIVAFAIGSGWLGEGDFLC